MGFRVFVREIEGRPQTQYTFHRIMSRVWLGCMVVTIPIVIFAPAFWAKIGILLVAEISYYANYATDTGAMAAANASTEDDITAYAVSVTASEKMNEEAVTEDPGKSGPLDGN